MLSLRCSHRLWAAFLALTLLLPFAALGAQAVQTAGPSIRMDVAVTLWKTDSDDLADEDAGIDSDRTATLARQPNGTYTLELPIKSFTMLGLDTHLTGLCIGEICYSGELSGSLEDGTGVLVVKNLPSSVLTGGDLNQAVTVGCNLQTGLSLLGQVNTSARMCIETK